MRAELRNRHRPFALRGCAFAAVLGILVAGCTSAITPDDGAALATFESSGSDSFGGPTGGAGAADRPVPGDDGPGADVPPRAPRGDVDGASPDRDAIVTDPGVDPDPGSEPIIADPAEPVDPDLPEPPRNTQSGTLTAGTFDDNLNYEVYRDFVSDMLQNDADGVLPDVELGQRILITVSNESGAPIGDARVLVSAAGEGVNASVVLLDLTTGSDGRVLFLTGIDGPSDATEFSVTVEPPDDSDAVTRTFEAGALEWGITLQGVVANPPAQLDLAFVVDTTGSMGDELEFLKIEMDAIAAAIADEFPNVDQRYALVVYRDQGDRYVTRTFDFTAELGEFQANLSDQRAAGGGDYPEAMHLALEEASGLAWRERDTARVLFLVADAPPHAEFAQRALEAVGSLRAAGVAIYPVAASGVAAEAELIMRTAALQTLSQYLFLTDDSGVGNAHAEPHIPCYHVERLDQAMIRMVANELSGLANQPDPETIIRTVGNPVNGVCTGE
ncbi:MAG: VWA domain-containing protein [Planctomycetes bacterium]|nr:VWA domain-containing protein [Planctomycetota bacterium]